jgi:predicted transcriptional regulator of viral defense system
MDDIKIIEKLMVEKGRIITYDDLKETFSTHKDINKKILRLSNKGLLVSLRRGFYYIAKLGSLGYTSISNYIIANTIGEQSFVSFEAALKYHGLYDQGLKKILSISQKQYLDKQIESITYKYIKVKESRYFGFEEYKVDGGNARIAVKERAILDILEYRRTTVNVSLIQEKLKKYSNEFDIEGLISYAKYFSQITIKTLGLLLDFIGKETGDLNLLITENSTSRISEDSNKFSNKWRLYYNSVLEEDISD